MLVCDDSKIGGDMSEIKIKKINEIYSWIDDEISKEIFVNRLLYSLTEDVKYIRNIVCTIKEGKDIYNKLKTSSQKKVIFGAGSVGKRIARIFDDIKFECFVDNKCVGGGQNYNQYSIIDINKLKEQYREALIIIATNRYHSAIKQQLLGEGFNEANIINIGEEYEKLNHLQYFDLPQLESAKKKREIFVDGGCFDGNSSIDFVNWLSKSGGEGHIYAWEPDELNRRNCIQALEEIHIDYQMIPKGLWSEYAEKNFKSSGGSSSIFEEGDINVVVDSIDNCIDKPITFIKMDVEGAEYQALLGAKRVIKEYKPKLAICIYHKLEDIWELPWLIHTINPEYKFYLRHYSFGDVETVLYAL